MSKHMTPNQPRRNQKEKAGYNSMNRSKRDKAHGESTEKSTWE